MQQQAQMETEHQQELQQRNMQQQAQMETEHPHELQKQKEINIEEEDGDWSKLPFRVTAVWWLMKKTGKLIRRSDGTINRRLLALSLKMVPPSATPKHGVSTADHLIDTAPGVSVRVFTPVPIPSSTTAPAAVPVILFFHGGCFCIMAAAEEHYDSLCRKLASSVPAVVVSVEYRLAPEHKFPAAYDDCAAALAWLGSPSARAALPASANVERCLLMGDSSGANIVHHVGLRHAKNKGSDDDDVVVKVKVKVVGHVVVQPLFGGEERTVAEERLRGSPVSLRHELEWYWRAFLPAGASLDHPCANVMLGGPGCFDGVQFPPSVVVIGGLDTLKDWQMRYVRFLRSACKSARVLYYRDAVHGFALIPSYALASELLADVCSFIRSVSGSGSGSSSTSPSP